MKKPIFIISALFAAAVGTAGVVMAQAPDSKSTDGDDVHITVRAHRGRLGFAALQISPELREHLGAPATAGVLVDHVRPGSPAERAGLRVGDVITEVDGESSRSAADILAAISDRKKGDVVTLDVIRDRGRVELRAKLDDDPGPTWRAIESWDFDARGFDPDFLPRMFDDDDVRKTLDEMRRRMDELERRMRDAPGARDRADKAEPRTGA